MTQPSTRAASSMRSPIMTKMMAAEKPTEKTEATMVPLCSACSSSVCDAPSFVPTKLKPMREATMPAPAMKKGSAMSTRSVSPSVAHAMMEPTKDSKRSAPMPATSPTLSPTLSAMVAGLRGSSSGMPCSTLPTRSAPTSAAFV